LRIFSLSAAETGKEPAAEIRALVKERFARLSARGVTPGLAIVTVGEPPGGNPYVRSKSRAAEELGVCARVERMAESTGEQSLHEKLRTLSADRTVHGIILQLPLPAHLHEDRYLEDIAPEKDVDGLHPLNVGRWVHGLPAHRPATPLGVLELLRRHCGDLTGKRVVIIGRSRIVGRPLSVFLSERAPGLNATVTLCHSGTRDLESITKEAEILVVAMGHRRAVTARHVYTPEESIRYEIQRRKWRLARGEETTADLRAEYLSDLDRQTEQKYER
jgi:methylenetetrahydrofolate dehydrogenase (NADP+)/methenyltetrahydrofolate cyclohydrolase